MSIEPNFLPSHIIVSVLKLFFFSILLENSSKHPCPLSFHQTTWNQQHSGSVQCTFLFLLTLSKQSHLPIIANKERESDESHWHHFSGANHLSLSISIHLYASLPLFPHRPSAAALCQRNYHGNAESRCHRISHALPCAVHSDHCINITIVYFGCGNAWFVFGVGPKIIFLWSQSWICSSLSEEPEVVTASTQSTRNCIEKLHRHKHEERLFSKSSNTRSKRHQEDFARGKKVQLCTAAQVSILLPDYQQSVFSLKT